MNGLKPEKSAQANVTSWALQKGFRLDVFDSKAVFSVKANMYKKSPNMREGHPDLAGVSPQGFYVAIELKAPGKETACRLLQWTFLKEKIESNGFGVVVSDPETLDALWSEWILLRSESLSSARQFLLNNLPKSVLVKVGKSWRVISAPSF